MRYILVVKEEDHKILMEWVNEQRRLQEVSRLRVKDRKGRLHVYEWINGVPMATVAREIGVTSSAISKIMKFTCQQVD